MTLNYTELQVEQEARRALSHVTRRLAEDWLALHAEVTRLRATLEQLHDYHALPSLEYDEKYATVGFTDEHLLWLLEQARAALRPEGP